MRLVIIAAALFMGASCTATSNGVYEVRWDAGGDTNTYVAHIDGLNRSGTQIELGMHGGKGYCASACTMYLGADNVCIWPNTHFEFHGAIPYPGESASVQTARIASYYATPLRAWFYQKAYRAQFIAVELSAPEVQRLSGVPWC